MATPSEEMTCQANARPPKELVEAPNPAATKYNKVLLIICSPTTQCNNSSSISKALRDQNFKELIFEVKPSCFVNAHILGDHVIKQFNQQIAQQVEQDAVVFVYIPGITTYVEPDENYYDQMYMGVFVVQSAPTGSLAYLLAFDIQRLLAELETDLLTIFLDGRCNRELKLTLSEDSIEKRRLLESLKKSTTPENMWKSLVPHQSRVVLLHTVCSRDHTSWSAADCHCSYLCNHFTAVLQDWMSCRNLISGVNHKDFYEAVSYHLYYQSGLMTSPCFFIQGDVERQFCGSKHCPYDHWVAGEYDDDNMERITVLNNIFEFKKDEQVDLCHLLQPNCKGIGVVASANCQSCTVKLNCHKSLSLKARMEQLSMDWRVSATCPDFLAVKKRQKEMPKFSLPVAVCTEDKDVEGSITAAIQESTMLRVATERDKDCIVVCEVIDSETWKINDKAKDVCPVQVSTSNLHKLIAALKQMVWFKIIKKNQNTTMNKLNFSCNAVNEHTLLNPSMARPMFNISASSELCPANAASQSVWQINSLAVWKPAERTQCYLEIDLFSNHIITAVELKGDANADQYVETFDFMSKTCSSQEVEIEMLNDLLQLSNAAKEVTFTIPNCTQLVNFKFSFLQRSLSMLGKEPVNLSHIEDYNYNAPDATVRYTGGWFEWTASQSGDGRSCGLHFNIVFRERLRLLQLKFKGQPREGVTGKLNARLQFISDWNREVVNGCASVWPVKRELTMPIKAARVRIVPINSHNCPAMQIQLHGTMICEGKLIDVYENEVVTFYFCNEMAAEGLYFSVLCLEETGAIKKLLSEYVEPEQVKKRSIKVYIADELLQLGYYSTLDTYKVYTSQRKPHLDGLLQNAFLNYDATSYNVFAPPKNSSIKDDSWAITDLPIRINKRPS